MICYVHSTYVTPVALMGYRCLNLINASCGDHKETSPAHIITVSGIYQIRNLVNGKIYVGSAVDLRNRRACHFKNLRKNKHHSPHLQNSFNKYGENAFVFEVLITCHSSMCIWYEQQFLDQWQPGYNISPTAGSPLGVRHTDIARKNMSDAAKKRAQVTPSNLAGVMNNPKIRAKISATHKARGIRPPSQRGMKYSKATKSKMSQSNRRRTITEVQARRAKQLLEDGDSVSNVAKTIGTHYHTIWGIANGHSWRWI